MAKKKSGSQARRARGREPGRPEEQEGGGPGGPRASRPRRAGLSKAEAIRRVIADGIDNPSLGSQEIKKRFDLDVTPSALLGDKGKIQERKKQRAKPKGKPGRKPKAAASSQAVEGYLAPRRSPRLGVSLICSLRSRR